DEVRLPHVRVNLTVDPLEFVQLANDDSRVGDEQAPRLGERLRIKKTERRAVGQPPPFAGVLERAQLFEGIAVVDEPELRLPRQLEERLAPGGDPFAEILRRQGNLLQSL